MFIHDAGWWGYPLCTPQAPGCDVIDVMPKRERRLGKVGRRGSERRAEEERRGLRGEDEQHSNSATQQRQPRTRTRARARTRAGPGMRYGTERTEDRSAVGSLTLSSELLLLQPIIRQTTASSAGSATVCVPLLLFLLQSQLALFSILTHPTLAASRLTTDRIVLRFIIYY
ncbi:hypothetical protein DL98DRAFT_531921 [Cadophora sp. DSE1049]|nr:hypothetical protein DL98DRAFT_531921 [Cadophora sp. DSE1049]